MASVIPIIIAGSTACGKSDISEQLCDALNGVIINADSLQIYKGLPKLTAQPSLQEGRHFLYSHFEPWDKCEVVRWLLLVEEAIRNAEQQGKHPIIVGGTGFYIKVLTEGIAPIPYVSEEVLAKAESLTQRHGIQFLYDELKNKTPNLSEHIKPTDVQRVMRYWSVLMETGKSLQEWYQLQQPKERNVVKVLCLRDRDILYQRINQRFFYMWKNGIVDEVQVFRTTYQNIENNYAAKAIGFHEVEAYLQGAYTEANAIELAQTKTRQYAKRQLTWFRHQFKANIVLDESQLSVDKILMFCHNSGIRDL